MISKIKSNKWITTFMDKNSTELSINQQAIWLEAKLYKNKPIFNIGTYAQINGILDLEILEQSIQHVISENDALRIRIGSISTIPEQFFEEQRNFTLKTHKFDTLKSAMSWMNKDFTSSVEIYSESLYSISLVIAQSQCFLYFKHHHIYIDGWSRAQLLQKIAQHYNGILSSIEVNTSSSYKSYLETMSSLRKDLDQSINFWKQEFSDINRVSLFSKKNATLQFAHSKRKRFVFPRDKYCKLQIDVKQDLKSKFYFLLATLYVTLSRSTGNQEIIFGVPLLNRFNETEKLTIGYFVGLIPLRLNFSPDTSFLAIVKGIQTKMRSTVSYRNIAIHEINRSVGVNFSNLTQLYDVVFSFEPHNHDCNFGEFEVTHAGTFSSDFEQNPLVIHVQDFNKYDDVNFEFDYNLSYLSTNEVDVLITRFKNLLHYYRGNTEALIGNARILFKEERIKLHDFGTGLFKELTSNNVISPILDKALEYPDKVIVTDENGTLTYTELLHKSKKLASHLMSLGVEQGEVVAVMVPREKDSIVRILGTLMSGACYVPIDPYLQPSRICSMLNDANVKRIVAHVDFELIKVYNKFEIVKQEKIEDSFDYRQPLLSEKSLAYILFTSGTTGKPKGVKICHGSVVNLIDGLNQSIYQNYPGKGNLALMSSFNFDAAIQQLFASLLLGRMLVIAPSDVRKDGKLILNFLVENEIEISDGIPTHVLSMITRTSKISELSNLKHLIIGGEVFGIDLAKRFFEWCENKDIKVSNVYGPTECTVDSTIFTFDKNLIKGLTSIPIGKPMQNTYIYVLDENQQLLPLGQKGEIYIGGAGVSSGYINQPTLTDNKFIYHKEIGKKLYYTGDIGKWNENGLLCFLGRKDNQVKVRGYRIELSEIEYWINQIDSVEQSIVLLDERGKQSKIIGFYQTKEQLKESEIKDQLSNNIPAYMIPHFLKKMSELPLTSTGKIDRKKLLRAGFSQIKIDVEPTTEMEQKVTSVFADILELEKVDVEESFFSLGGDSLGLVFLLAKLEELFDTSISMSEFGAMNSVRKIAYFLESNNKIEEKSILLKDELNSFTFSHSQNLSKIGSDKVFITGGTGFVGAFLIQELCTIFEEVYCLIRAKDKSEAEERLKKALVEYQITTIDWKKIKIVAGDLSEDRLGMSICDWEEISDVDQIYHCGAMVNFMKDFESMKKTNLHSTYNLLRLCQKGKPKRFNYISTKGVFNSKAENCFENDSLENEIHFKNRGYESTKWLSDILTNRARSFGIESNIFRLGRITGHSDNSTARYKDFFHRFIEGCIALRCFPHELINLSTDLTPVDISVEAIVMLSNQLGGHNYHIVNNNLTLYKGIVDSCLKINIELEILPYSGWLDKVEALNKETQDNPLYLITSILKQKTWFTADTNILNSNETSYIIHEKGIDWPLGDSLWVLYIENCVNRLIENEMYI
jgi:amino acid adenylation domain-containing protein/thioester reductase-like protein